MFSYFLWFFKSFPFSGGVVDRWISYREIDHLGFLVEFKQVSIFALIFFCMETFVSMKPF